MTKNTIDGNLPEKEQSSPDSILGQEAGVEKKNARRTLLRNTVIGGGVVISTVVAPDKWKKPLLDAIILPSHAQTSGAAVVMGGGGGIVMTETKDNGFDVDDILGIFVGEAHADSPSNLPGGCVLLTVEGSVAKVDMTLNTNAVDTKTGTVNGTGFSVTGLHTDYTVSGTLDSATAPTSATGIVSGLGESGSFTVSSADPVCAPVMPTKPPQPPMSTTVMPTKPPMPNSNVMVSFSLSKPLLEIT